MKLTKQHLYKVINKEATIYKIAKENKISWHKASFMLLPLAIKELRKK